MAARKAPEPPSWGGLVDGDLVLVDSAPLIYWLDGHPRFAALFEGLFALYDQGRIDIAVSTITIAEVLVGPFKNAQIALAKRYEKALTGFDVVAVSPEIAITGARLRAGTGLRLPDALQAATALEIGAKALVTHDRDFSKIEGLRVLMGPAAAAIKA